MVSVGQRPGEIKRTDGLGRFPPLVERVFKRDLTHGGGQQPHDAQMMFKATLLGQWHNLSDPALEVSLRGIDFIVFCGKDWATDMPMIKSQPVFQFC